MKNTSVDQNEISQGQPSKVWLKIIVCCTLLVLAGIDHLYSGWPSSLGWPWNGLFEMGEALIEVSSPIVLIYLLIVLKKWANW